MSLTYAFLLPKYLENTPNEKMIQPFVGRKKIENKIIESGTDNLATKCFTNEAF